MLPEHLRERFGVSKGIVITYIDENGAAAKAGLVGMGQDEFSRYYLGDVVLEIDGKEVNNYDDIFHILDQMKIGDEVLVKYLRDGKTKTTKVKLTAI